MRNPSSFAATANPVERKRVGTLSKAVRNDRKLLNKAFKKDRLPLEIGYQSKWTLPTAESCQGPAKFAVKRMPNRPDPRGSKR